MKKINISRYDIEDAIFVFLFVLVIVGITVVGHKQSNTKPTQAPSNNQINFANNAQAKAD
ncbi:MAG TPA: hypothetical protein VLF79_02395 [Candidatus Saccharimonadales bacterium]|nr:hypothetical protein [Candidatus Saccharimonadales bacterium]